MAPPLSPLFVFAPGPFGGAERVVIAGLKALKAAGAAPRLVLLRETRAPEHANKISTALGDSVPVDVVDIAGRFDLKPLKRLKGLLSQHPADIIHAHGYKAAIYLSLIKTPPLVATHHGTTSHTALMRLYEKLERWALRRAAHTIAVSDVMHTHLIAKGCAAARTTTIENMLGLDIPSHPITPPAANAPLKILFLGRLSIEKGLDVLLEATRVEPRLADPSQFHFVIAGDGPERTALEATAPSSFTFLGFVEDAAALLGDAHAMVVPSRTEGMPMAVIEAAAAGLPIIASRVGGLPELVRDGQTGHLVPPDAPADLAAALMRVREDPAPYIENAATYADEVRVRFSAQHWADQTLSLYQSVLAR